MVFRDYVDSAPETPRFTLLADTPHPTPTPHVRLTRPQKPSKPLMWQGHGDEAAAGHHMCASLDPRGKVWRTCGEGAAGVFPSDRNRTGKPAACQSSPVSAARLVTLSPPAPGRDRADGPGQAGEVAP